MFVVAGVEYILIDGAGISNSFRSSTFLFFLRRSISSIYTSACVIPSFFKMERFSLVTHPSRGFMFVTFVCLLVVTFVSAEAPAPDPDKDIKKSTVLYNTLPILPPPFNQKYDCFC